MFELEKSLEEKTEIKIEREKLVRHVKSLQDDLNESGKITNGLSRRTDMEKRNIKLLNLILSR